MNYSHRFTTGTHVSTTWGPGTVESNTMGHFVLVRLAGGAVRSIPRSFVR